MKRCKTLLTILIFTVFFLSACSEPYVVADEVVLEVAPETPIQTTSVSWEEAYADFLRDPSNFHKEGHFEEITEDCEFTFVLRDLTGGGVPELLIYYIGATMAHGSGFLIHTFYDGEVNFLDYMPTWRAHGQLSASGSFDFPGIFFEYAMFDIHYVYYGELVEGQTVITEVHEDDWHIYSTWRQARPFSTHAITEANIYDIIFNWAAFTSRTTFQISDEIVLTIAHVNDQFYGQVAFSANVPLRNFRYIEINGAELEFDVENTLHWMDMLLPEDILVVDWFPRGSMPHRGISFMDGDVTRYFAFHYDARGYYWFRLQEFPILRAWNWNEDDEITFTPNSTLRDFQVFDMANREVLEVVDEVSPDNRFTTTWNQQGDTPSMGISFIDENNMRQFFYLDMNQRPECGSMGSFVLTHFLSEPAPLGPTHKLTNEISITVGDPPAGDKTQIKFEEQLTMDERYYVSVALTANVPLNDFKWLELIHDDYGFPHVSQQLFSLDTLPPETPFVVNWRQHADLYPHRGISFVDEAGRVRRFGFHASGFDGSLLFIDLDVTTELLIRILEEG
ncbi:MAG: hypothetical protein FWC76_04515 [Defluviitaleaceae bacterium]|nr:hypothetical protein [Defluviitaleaceae bacterium]